MRTFYAGSWRHRHGDSDLTDRWSYSIRKLKGFILGVGYGKGGKLSPPFVMLYLGFWYVLFVKDAPLIPDP
jgi:hypothetical protein